MGIFAVFLLGALMGACANVFIYWMYDHSVFGDIGRCTTCTHPYRVRHRVPILSWFFRQGVCDHCGKRTRFFLPWLELIMACLMVFTYIRFMPFLSLTDVWRFVGESLFLFALLVCVGFDAKWKLLPIEFMGGMTLVLFVFQTQTHVLTFTSSLLGLLFGCLFLALQFFVSKGKWMGGGDLMLGVLLGAALGWPLIAASYYFTYVIGGILLLIGWGLGWVRLRSRIPFAPFLAGGACLALWFGNGLVDWFLRVF